MARLILPVPQYSVTSIADTHRGFQITYLWEAFAFALVDLRLFLPCEVENCDTDGFVAATIASVSGFSLSIEGETGCFVYSEQGMLHLRRDVGSTNAATEPRLVSAACVVTQ
jgi:hypothetical protein